ncbi:RNA polymerase ECF-type sigma factor [Filimonas lacunae]|nr:RNA polymerase ECF-type sigma factor [Filimonas lacunae]
MFHAYTPSLYASALQVVKQEETAREIVQETFLKVWLNREALAYMDNPSGWLYRVASNLAISQLRKQATEHKWMHSQPFDNTTTNDVLETISFREARQLLHQAIEALPPKRKLIFQLSRQEELSHAEIAAQLNMSQNTVKNQIVLASKFVENYIQKHAGTYLPLFLLLMKKYF